MRPHPPDEIFQESNFQSIDNPYEKVVIHLLDEFHDKIDMASWRSAQEALFFSQPERRWGIDLSRLTVDELDDLDFYPGEFKLLKQLCLKDDYSLEHSLRVMAISLRVAHMLGLSKPEKKILAKGAVLHDIGKASCNPLDGKDLIDDYILKSYYSDAASADEMRILKRHVEYGVNDLIGAYKRDGVDNPEVIRLVSLHHERADGSGYPNRLKLTDHDLLSQIVSFSDTIEAMTTKKRVYQKTFSFGEIKWVFEKYLTAKFSNQIMDLILNDQTRELIEREVEESELATEKIFF